MSPLTREELAATDPSGMLDTVLAQPHQVGDALWRVQSAGLAHEPRRGGLVVCGMGGSAVGGDLAVDVVGRRATAPIVTVRDYVLPGWVGGEHLVLCASYSGGTEETLACYDAAVEAGAERVVLTTGGPLAERARADGVPVIGVPSGMQPRAAVVYMIVAALECAAACGATPSLAGEVEAAGPLLEELAEEWGPDAGENSTAKALAQGLHGTLPVIHGAGTSTGSARRWQTQIAENAKGTAFSSRLPEADHNEVCGWERGRREAPLSAVFLEAPGARERVARRMALTAELVSAAGAPTERVAARGETSVEHVLSLVFLGDLVSVYLASLAGVDPTPIEAIERLKSAL